MLCMQVLLLLSTLAGSFTSIYGRHLYTLSGYNTVSVNSTEQLPNASSFGDAFSATVFAFDLEHSTIRNGAASCTVVSLDEERYNETSWTVFPYLAVREAHRFSLRAAAPLSEVRATGLRLRHHPAR
jgi:hypothetical protein